VTAIEVVHCYLGVRDILCTLINYYRTLLSQLQYAAEFK